MLKSHVKVYRYRLGKNRFLIIRIYRKATAHVNMGNALASNALNVKVFVPDRLRRKARR